MKKDAYRDSLLDFVRGLEIIDTHEHLVCERDRLAREVDVLTLLHLYEYVDMTSAGYRGREGESVFANNLLLDTEAPLEERWEAVWPYLQNIQCGTYYRPVKIALRDLYGIEALNGDTYQVATEKIRAANKAGLYHWVLREKCNIRTSLVQNGRVEGQDPADIFTPLFADVDTYQFNTNNFFQTLQETYEQKIGGLDAYLELLTRYLDEMRRQGAVGFKMAAGEQVGPDVKRAGEEFGPVLRGEKPSVLVQSTVLDHILKYAGEHDWPVAVHCGIWWDYRTVDSKYMIDIVMRYPQVRFDLYHLGMPSVRDTIFIAKNFANAFLNLCWTYIVSQEITRRAINEILDTVPINKVFGFGADCCWAVESVYGHLVMARETLATALAERLERGQISEDEAKRVLRMWLVDNAVGFYRLET